MESNTLAPTTLSHYVRLNSCDRYLWFRLFPDRTKALLKQFEVTEQPLASVLSEVGREFEQSVVEAVRGLGYPMVDLREAEAPLTVQRLRALEPGRCLALTQAPLSGVLGSWACAGRADLILAQAQREGPLDLLIADVKASREDRVEHRLQVAFYVRLLEQMLAAAGLLHRPMQGAILHRSPDGGLPDLRDGPIPVLNLGPYLTALDNLLADDGAVSRVAKTPFDHLAYHLNYQCDGCMFNGLCVTESAVRQDLSLIPYLQPVEKRALRAQGICTLEQVVALKTWPTGQPVPKVLPPAPGQEPTVRGLSAWPVGPVLDRLVVRARAVLHRYDPTVAALPFLPNAPYSELPVGDDLVRVYLDAQHDYVQGRVYLLGTLVEGPTGEQLLTHLTPTAPDDAAERELFVRWTHDLTEALRACAGGEVAKVHCYVFDRYDQKVILEGLKRHLAAVAAIPAFYDLLTQTAALTQSMVSFLSEEVRERRALSWLNQSLVRVAQALGFDWRDGDLHFFRLFQARIFDDRRTRGAVPTEAAARFNSQIPLEYAYAIWGLLREDPIDPKHRPLLAPFRLVTRDQLLRFQQHRLRALRHIEAKLRPSKSAVDKEPLNLRRLGDENGPATDLPQALVNFLYMEHHAQVQERLRLYGLPIQQRAQTGRALLLRCVTELDAHKRATFEIDFAGVGLDPNIGMEIVRFREGAWGVINPLLDDDGAQRTGRRLASGTVCIVQSVDRGQITVEFAFTGRGDSKFRFRHWVVPIRRGERYVLDEMADNLLGDRLVEACQHAQTNLLLRLASDPRAVPAPITSTPSREELTNCLAVIGSLEAPNQLTERQQEVIGQRRAEPGFLVQGPPGTGKTHTLAWAVLARLAGLPSHRRPRLVVVSSKTHNAINLVLASIADKGSRLQEQAPTSDLARSVRGVRVYKLGGDGDAPSIPGVTQVGMDEKGLLAALKKQDLTVIGATPGGLYNWLKYTGGVDWMAKLFDLAVLDEASQMSLPEAVLACAFLKEGGQVIVVGDHRQMPPILAHEWKEEGRQEALEFQPYRSVFEFLLGLGVPKVGLDESFRLHRVLAGFLAEHIYKQDGIPFFSRRTATLERVGHPDPFLAAVLHPEYPMVIVEHGQEGSQQANPTEAALVTPIIQACAAQLRLNGRTGMGVVVPHRAQKALLRDRLGDLAATGSIDTVERFQGGERDVIIVSATVSDPDYALTEAEFLMDARRLNVAISRPRKKLIVVGASVLFRLLPSDVEIFDQASIWKALRFLSSPHLLWSGALAGVPVRVFGQLAG